MCGSKTNRGGVLMALCLLLFTLTACTGTPVSLHNNLGLPSDQVAILKLEDSSMILRGVTGTLNDERRTLSKGEASSARSFEVLPGTYDVSLVYEHIAQSRCWDEGLNERCTRTLDRGWWLPGSSLVPGTAEWIAEPGKTYVVKRLEDYWAMAEHNSWQPVIVECDES